MDRIKKLSMEILEDHKGKFGTDFDENKKILNQISIIRSKGLKNEVAGYITKFLKREIHDLEEKQSTIENTAINNEDPQIESETLQEIPNSASN